MNYEIRAATLADIRALANAARPMDRAEVEGWGLCWRHTLQFLYRDSTIKRVALVDGEVAAIWGVQGPIVGDDGSPWLFTTPAVERARLAFFRETKREIEAMLVTHRRLRAYTLASYERSIRFFHALGFSFGDPEPVGVNGTAYRLMTLERPKSDRRPVVIYGLPRSRTFWLSRFLSYGDWEGWHEPAIRFRGVEDVRSWFAQDCTVTADTGAATWWRLIQSVRPDAKVLVVRRPVAEVVDSLMRLDMRGTAAFDRASLTRRLERMDRKLDQIEARVPAALSVRFDDLASEDTCARVFEHCLPYGHNPDWWGKMAAQNLQCDLPALVRYQTAHAKQINRAVASCKAETERLMRGRRRVIHDLDITLQEETLETFWRDGRALFDAHCAEVGEEDFTLLNLPLASQMERAGALRVMTARAKGEMVGYLATIIAPSMRRHGAMTATHTIIFVAAKARHLNLGVRLTAAASESARRAGASEVLMRAGVRGEGPRLSALARRLGAEPYGELYRLDLES